MGRKTIEQQQRFSQSLLWQMQREYFDREGVNAWVKQVPFYVTSNPFIANAYANIAIAFIRDWLVKHPESIDHPFYLLELGTGCGMFSFYMNKRLNELKAQYQMHSVKTVYVMSDFTASNLDFWREHPALKPAVQQGQVDFALYNLEEDVEITLVNSGAKLDQAHLKNPLVVCGNYIFDTISHDAFTMQAGKLHESLISIHTDADNIENQRPIDWAKADIEHHARPIDSHDYYDDPEFNAVLNSYIGRLFDTHFLLPLAGLRTIRHLRRLTNDRMLLISSDKSYNHIDELEGLNHPSLAFHGSFSMMVNYDAFAEYFKRMGGDAYLQSIRKGLKSNVFVAGAKFSELSETQAAIARHFEGVSPADYFVYHRHISDHFNELAADILASHLNFSQWDPYMFHRVSPRILEVLAEAQMSTRQYLADGMKKIEANYYFMPSQHDTMFDIAILFHTLKKYDEALRYYEKSEALFGEQFNIIFNKALCYYYLGETQKSLHLFRQAHAQDKTSEQVQEWIHFLESGEQPAL